MTSNTPEDPKTLERQRVILAVLAGQMSVTQAALELGVSRKTYYEWQERALAAMRLALQDRPGGRPSLPLDPEKQQLQEQVETLEQERLLLESRLRIQQVIGQTLAELQPPDLPRSERGQPPKKKRTV